MITTASCHGHFTRDDVRHRPFIKQHASGWNDRRYPYIEHLTQHGVVLNYEHSVDTVSFALQLMKKQRVANVMPASILNPEFSLVEGSEFLDLDISLATNIPMVDRSNPLHQYLHDLLVDTLKSQIGSAVIPPQTKRPD